MPSPKAYNSLGQILTHGGEIGLAIRISRGLSESDALSVISERYPGLPIDQQRELYDIAEAAALGGRTLNELSADQQIPLEAIPINPYLFGAEPLGRRMLVAVEMSNSQTGQVVQVREPINPSDTIGQMIHYLESLIDAWSEQSPDLAEALQLERQTLLEQFFLMAERRF